MSDTTKNLLCGKLSCWAMIVTLLLSGAFLSSCDSDTGSFGGGNNPDTTRGIDFDVPACMATFTETYEATDSWDDVVYTIKKGEKLILAAIDPVSNEAMVYYLSEAGPFEFKIAQNDAGAYPFETDCDENSIQRCMGVFADTTIYADQELNTELCTVDAGKSVASSSYGFSLVDDLANGDSIYELTYNAIVEECGASTGYILVPEAEIFPNLTSWLIPLRTYLCENE